MSRKGGPKATPTALLEITGGKRKGGPNLREPVPDGGMPPMPEWLHPYAQAEWHFIVPHLWAMKILTVVDKAMVAAYCAAYGWWRLAEEKMQEVAKSDPVSGGLLMKTISGNLIQNPLLGTANAARRDLMRAAAELGLSPAARAQLEAERDDDDPISKKFGL